MKLITSNRSHYTHPEWIIHTYIYKYLYTTTYVCVHIYVQILHIYTCMGICVSVYVYRIRQRDLLELTISSDNVVTTFYLTTDPRPTIITSITLSKLRPK